MHLFIEVVRVSIFDFGFGFGLGFDFGFSFILFLLLPFFLVYLLKTAFLSFPHSQTTLLYRCKYSI